MKRSIGILAMGLFLWQAATAQPGKNPRLKDEQEVEKVVLDLFAGMKSGDSAAVHLTCVNNARLVTSFADREGNPGVEEITLTEFLAAIGSPHTEIWNEVPASIDIRVEDNLAVAWVPYSFYVDDKFSHCGVDAIQLVKDKSGWKILNITDTRRVTGCNN